MRRHLMTSNDQLLPHPRGSRNALVSPSVDSFPGLTDAPDEHSRDGSAGTSGATFVELDTAR